MVLVVTHTVIPVVVGVVLSPQRGGFIIFKSGHETTRGGFKGGFIPHLGGCFYACDKLYQS